MPLSVTVEGLLESFDLLSEAASFGPMGLNKMLTMLAKIL